MIDVRLLENVGLSRQESAVYLAAVELGESLHKTLAEKAQVKRPTLYGLLPGLIDRGLIIETVKGKRRYLVPQDLESFLERRKTELERVSRLLPELRTLLATASVKPRVTVYEGVEGIKKVWYDHLVQKHEIIEIVGIENIHPALTEYLKRYYIIERTRRRIPLRMLISGPAVVGAFKMKSDPYELREVKTINGNLFPIPLGLDVYGESVSITLHREDSEPVGIIIRSSEISIALRSLFDFIWRNAR